MSKLISKASAAPEILAAYDTEYPLRLEFTRRLEELLRDLVEQEELQVHSITSRVKKRDSLEQKLKRADATYADLRSVTDICGIRVITYFNGDVDRIAKIIEREFKIDQQNSVDKGAVLDPDKFGYLSLHYVFELTDARLALPEYKRYKGCVAEVQLRSIIQHAWAEIEHDLGYKSKQAIPQRIRRRFFRLAAMLEIADDEFANLKSAIDQHSNNVRETLAAGSLDVLIDTASIEVLIKESTVIRRLDETIAKNANGYLGKRYSSSTDVGAAQCLELRTLGDLVSALEDHELEVIGLARRWLTRTPEPQEIPPGISLFYLYYVLATRNGDVDTVRKLLDAGGIDLENNRAGIARRLVVAMTEIRGEIRMSPRLAS